MLLTKGTSHVIMLTSYQAFFPASPDHATPHEGNISKITKTVPSGKRPG